MTCDQTTALFVGPGSCQMSPRGDLEKHAKGKKATHLHVFLKKTPSAAEVSRFSTKWGCPNLQRRATHGPKKCRG